MYADEVFRSAQRAHQCTDCGYGPPLLGALPARKNVYEGWHGGGTLVLPAAPVSELHIVPHGGTQLPSRVLTDIDSSSYSALATLVHENLDLGTGAMYRRLADLVGRGSLPTSAVAAFHVSRIVLDPNRAQRKGQVTETPYSNSAKFQLELPASEKEGFRQTLLLPWLDAVCKVISTSSLEVVYHHHTYDLTGLSPRSNDRGGFEKRPAFQLFSRRDNHERLGLPPTFASAKTLSSVEDRIRNFLYGWRSAEDCDGSIDYPLRAVETPFHASGRDEEPVHLIYELRKDLLPDVASVNTWIDSRCWAVPSECGKQ
jgi:hypothetical protein